MDSDYVSSSEPAETSVCHVCQGFGDLSDPRGFTEKLQPDELMQYSRSSTATHEYIYIYVHHPNVGALMESAQAGCDVCEALCDRLKGYRGVDIDTLANPYPPVQGLKQPDSVAHTTLIDNDTQAANQFAKLIRQDRPFTDSHLEHYDNGRVVLWLACGDEFGPRACSYGRSFLEVTVLTTPIRKGGFTLLLKSPGTCYSREGCARK